MTNDAATGPSAALRAERAGAVLILTITRPDRGNALRAADAEEMMATLRSAEADEEVRAVLVTGHGKHFCAGADLVAANTGGGRAPVGTMHRTLDRGPHALVESLWSSALPTVAAVRGAAMGLGLHIALACDLVVAARSARFAEPFCKRGFSVDSGGSFLLPRLIGLTRAKQMLLCGREVDADTAAEWGMIAQAVDDDGLDATARKIAAELAAGPTVSLGMTKRMLNAHTTATIGEALSTEATNVELSIRTEDFKAGMRAFLDHAEPVFSGR